MSAEDADADAAATVLSACLLAMPSPTEGLAVAPMYAAPLTTTRKIHSGMKWKFAVHRFSLRFFSVEVQRFSLYRGHYRNDFRSRISKMPARNLDSFFRWCTSGRRPPVAFKNPPIKKINETILEIRSLSIPFVGFSSQCELSRFLQYIFVPVKNSILSRFIRFLRDY